MTRKIRFFAVDFFCGAGGTTRGLLDAGGYVIAGIDNEERCRETYEKNNKNKFLDKKHASFLSMDIFEKTENYPQGQQQEIFTILRDSIPKYRKQASDIPLVFAICAPCQPFTALANRSKMSSERITKRMRDSSLLLESLKFIKKFKPEGIISENVAGIGGSRFGNIWQEFEAELRELGYETASDIVCASKFGVPQYRKRSILLAIRRKHSKASGIKIKREDPKIKEPPSVIDAIGDLPQLQAGEWDLLDPNHRVPNLREKTLQRMRYAMPGVSNEYLHDTPEGDLSLACHRRANAKHKSRCFSDVYTRMAPDSPAPTITTKCHSFSNGRYGHYDTKQLRAISVREAAILQSFPRDYMFYPTGKIVPNSQMIGNAVPPKLAQFFADYLVELIAVN